MYKKNDSAITISYGILNPRVLTNRNTRFFSTVYRKGLLEYIIKGR